MLRPLRVVSVIGLLVGLSSCSVTTDRMRFHFDDERRGSFSLAAHADHVGKNDEGEEKNDPLHARKDPLERAIEDKMKACGLAGLTFRTEDDVEHINARTSFNYPDELEMSLACIPSGWDVVRVQSKRDEELLRYTYVTTIRFEQPRAEIDFADENKISLNSTDTFPRELSLTVPGTISKIDNATDILGADFKTEEYGTQEVRAMLTERVNAEALKDAVVAKLKKEVAAGRISALDVSGIPRNVYAVTVTSYQWRVKFQDILSIAGVLFGSGFLLQFIGSRLPAGKRRRQPARKGNRSS